MRFLAGIFQRRLRGFRIIDLAAFACLATLVLGVYAFKARAGGESARIAETDSQIADEERRIRLLDADLARLETPERLERLSGQYLGLAPIPAKHETTPASLMEIARQGASGPTDPRAKAAPRDAAATATPSAAAPSGATR